jgi:hypothetical protein
MGDAEGRRSEIKPEQGDGVTPCDLLDLIWGQMAETVRRGLARVRSAECT